jgi:hypothetical protein
MKKNLLGILALCFAIGLSSFSTLQEKKQTPYVWFDVDNGETATIGGVLLSAPPTGCENSTSDLCARGFDEIDCTVDTQAGVTTYTLNIDVDPDTEFEAEGYEF